MIGYFVKSGDISMSQKILPYIKEISRIISDRMDSNYGQGLNILLIKYYLEGKYLAIPNEEYRIENYREVDHSLSIVFYIPKKLISYSAFEMKNTIIQTSFLAIQMAKEKIENEKIFDVDFKKILFDYKICAELFLTKDIV